MARKKIEGLPEIGAVGADTKWLGRRDAFHIPVALVTSANTRERGEEVIFVEGDSTYSKVEYWTGSATEAHGFVDPFLKQQYVEAGTPFWVFIRPSLIKNLSHVFDLDIAIEDAPEKEPEYENDDDECNSMGC